MCQLFGNVVSVILKFMKLVIGLGNIGSSYENTRHNLGFMVVDHFAAKHKLPASQSAPTYASVQATDALLIKPTTYMNSSGVAVQQILDAHPSDLDQVLVIYDDVDLEFGTIRLRRGGASGGHKGLQSVIDRVGSGFWRMRIGIRNSSVVPGEATDFVLDEFTKAETEKLPQIIETANDLLGKFVSGQINAESMQSYKHTEV